MLPEYLDDLSEDARSILTVHYSEEKEQEIIEKTIEQLSSSDQEIYRQWKINNSPILPPEETALNDCMEIADLQEDLSIDSEILPPEETDLNDCVEIVDLQEDSSNDSELVEKFAFLLNLSDDARTLVEPMLECDDVSSLAIVEETLRVLGGPNIEAFDQWKQIHQPIKKNEDFEFMDSLTADSQKILFPIISMGASKEERLRLIEMILEVKNMADYEVFMNWKHPAPPVENAEKTCDHPLLSKLSEVARTVVGPFLFDSMKTDELKKILRNIAMSLDDEDAKHINDWIDTLLPSFVAELSPTARCNVDIIWKLQLSYEKKLECIADALTLENDVNALKQWKVEHSLLDVNENCKEEEEDESDNSDDSSDEDDEEEDDEDEETGDGDSQTYPDDLTILVLGESGVGKSTFINSFVNYLISPTLVNDEKPIILIRHLYAYTEETDDRKYKAVEHVFETTINASDETKKWAEAVENGKSKTKDPRVYKFKFEDNGKKKVINIIDTPGIQDADGPIKDTENFNKIMAFISSFPKLHGILLLMKPNLTVLNQPFRYCLNELLIRLHKSTSRNIFFCFTHTRETHFAPGGTLLLLQKHIEEIQKQQPGVNIKTGKTNVFCMDNESFTYMCGRSIGREFEDDHHMIYKLSWQRSVREVRRLMVEIGKIEPHDTQETLCLNNTRNLIVAISKPLAEITRNITKNVLHIEEKTKELREHEENNMMLTERLNVKEEVLIPHTIDYPMTVCTAERCVEYKRFGADPELKVHYKTICHSHCNLRGIPENVHPDDRLRRCTAMGGQETCRTCHCSWSQHQHIKYTIGTTIKYVVDPDVQKKLTQNNFTMEDMRAYIAKLNEKKDSMKAEQDTITNACAKFGVYLKKHSCLSHNDAYGTYLEMLIKEEEGKCSRNTGNVLEELKEQQFAYTEQVRLLKKSEISGVSAGLQTLEEVYDLLQQLRTLKMNGEVIRAVEKLELNYVKEYSGQMEGADTIDVGNFSRLTRMGKRNRKNNQ